MKPELPPESGAANAPGRIIELLSTAKELGVTYLAKYGSTAVWGGTTLVARHISDKYGIDPWVAGAGAAAAVTAYEFPTSSVVARTVELAMQDMPTEKAETEPDSRIRSFGKNLLSTVGAKIEPVVEPVRSAGRSVMQHAGQLSDALPRYAMASWGGAGFQTGLDRMNGQNPSRSTRLGYSATFGLATGAWVAPVPYFHHFSDLTTAMVQLAYENPEVSVPLAVSYAFRKRISYEIQKRRADNQAATDATE